MHKYTKQTTEFTLATVCSNQGNGRDTLECLSCCLQLGRNILCCGPSRLLPVCCAIVCVGLSIRTTVHGTMPSVPRTGTHMHCCRAHLVASSQRACKYCDLLYIKMRLNLQASSKEPRTLTVVDCEHSSSCNVRVGHPVERCGNYTYQLLYFYILQRGIYMGLE